MQEKESDIERETSEVGIERGQRRPFFFSKRKIRQLVPSRTSLRREREEENSPCSCTLETPPPARPTTPHNPAPDRASLAAAAAQRRAAAALFRRTGGTGREPRSRPFGVALMSLPSPPQQQQPGNNEFYYQQQQQQMQYQQPYQHQQPYQQQQPYSSYQQGGENWPRAHLGRSDSANNDADDAWALDGAPELRADQGTQLAASGGRLSSLQKAATPLPALGGGGGSGDGGGRGAAPGSVRARLAAARAALVANPESADRYGAMRTRTGLTPGGGARGAAAGEGASLLAGGRGDGDARAVRALLGEMAGGGAAGAARARRRRGGRRSSEGFGSDYDDDEEDEETPPGSNARGRRRSSAENNGGGAAAAARPRSSQGGADAAANAARYSNNDASAFDNDDFGGGGFGSGGGGWENTNNEEDDVGGWAATGDVDSSPLSSGGKGRAAPAAATSEDDGDEGGDGKAAAAPKAPRPPRNRHVRLKRALAGRASLAGDGIRVTVEEEADPDAPPGTVSRVRRRSARTKHRPLEWWRCERKEYGRPHRSLPTVRAVVSFVVNVFLFFCFLRVSRLF